MTRRKSMTHLAKEYLAYRRNLGFRLDKREPLLLQFATYADRTRLRGPLTIALAVRWARLPAQASPTYWSIRLDVVRGFAKYLSIFDPDTEIPPFGLLGPAYCRATPHIYAEAEISALLAAARCLSPARGLRPQTYATLFGLLACTGLRVSEALRLTRSDVAWGQHLLTVRCTKFRKTRLVPLHPTASQALQIYAQVRDRFHPLWRTERFFVARHGTPLSVSVVRSTFGKLRRQLGWAARSGARAPRIHDLRHTFACRRLLDWYKAGVPVDAMTNALATYLGHVDVSNTYWYLTGVPELLELAVARFEAYAATEGGPA
jgi:integrase